MEALKFLVPSVSKKFMPVVEKDRTVHVPGIYSGLLSNVTLAAAEQIVKEGGAGVIKLMEDVKPNMLTAKPEIK